MFPLLTDSLFESPADIPKDPYELLKRILSGFSKTTVKNGEHRGETLSRAVRSFGRGVLGKNGAVSTVFKDGGSAITPYIRRESETFDDGVIYPFGISQTIASAEGFSAELLSLDGKVGVCEEDSFLLIFAASGNYTVSHFGGTFRMTPGDTLFVPADFRIEILGTGDLVIIHT